MALKDTIGNVVEKLREGAFHNEQSVSQGIVLRILSDLHWDVFEPSVVWPEYATAGGGRADFALCEPRSKPKVLIEVKQPGKAEGGVRQSLEYAFHTGVPFVVLTDGQTWSFYLPAEPGDYEDRRVFKLDLYEHPAERSAAVLDGYLQWGRVASGEALESARSEYQSQTRRTVARRAIPSAWVRLVDQRDELLVELVSDAVESKEGVRPEDRDVVQFLVGLGPHTLNRSPARPSDSSDRPPKATVPASKAKAPPMPSVDQASTPRQVGVVVVRGDEFSYANAKEKMLIILRELANGDPTFLSRCYESSKFRGRIRRYVSRAVEELYPGRPDLQKDCVEELPGGWWVGTNLNNRIKEDLIRAAIEVAGLTLGGEVVFKR